MLKAKRKVTASLVPFCLLALSDDMDRHISTLEDELKQKDDDGHRMDGLLESLLSCLQEIRADFDNRWGDLDWAI
jgi:hypothetical protein